MSSTPTDRSIARRMRAKAHLLARPRGAHRHRGGGRGRGGDAARRRHCVGRRLTSRACRHRLIRNDRSASRRSQSSPSRAPKAVIVHIDSPGARRPGLSNCTIRSKRVAAAQADVIVVDGLAASGGYIAAMSVRLYRRAGNLAVWLDRRAVSVSEFLRGAEDHRREGRGDQVSPLKAAPNGFRADESRGARRVEALVRKLRVVSRHGEDGRKMDDATLETVTDGRVFTGGRGSRSGWSTELGTKRRPGLSGARKRLERHAGA